MLGPLPVIYPFIVNNPGEAVQAKRRLAAVTIGHLTPPLSAAGLHGPLAELEGMIEEYAAADGLDRAAAALSRRRDRRARLEQRARRRCGLIEGEPNRAAIAKLDAQLCDIKELSIRDGLHVFGRTPDEATVQRCSAAGDADSRGGRCAACGDRERAALLAALDGRRVAPGPAGAPTRGRADVLPTGRNLTSIDPRAIPTRTAAAIGVRAADEVVRRYLQDHGEPSARAGDRSLGLGLAAHRRRRSRPGAGLSRRAAGLGQGIEPRHRHRDHAAAPCSTGRAST